MKRAADLSRAFASGGRAPTARSRIKVVLYNPKAVFFTMPLALLAIGSELDPEVYEVVTDRRSTGRECRGHVAGASRGCVVSWCDRADRSTNLGCHANLACGEARAT